MKYLRLNIILIIRRQGTTYAYLFDDAGSGVHLLGFLPDNETPKDFLILCPMIIRMLDFDT
jgi:hypothetical protein